MRLLDIRAALRSTVRSCASGPSHNGSASAHTPSVFYEQRGPLPEPGRETNRYREYTEADGERLRLLVGLRELDIPLEQAAELATMCAAGRCDEVSEELRSLLTGKRRELGVG